ncbi:hypothetical protein PP7435_CHR3-0874 [Komagataella phaffii CBS 7435]|uniref:DUF4112 domain-containing protein n=2 Tax=Komagataella phaffii TaxID=460519 RepID=C4R494_KOMPG|nr:Hypothetical protein PAS_chr3_0341 [Komagataella phaffii GS115]AOA63510.1 GQ67_03401T0 [Komagataella phaffii]CAH2449869.1 hypothetical protein BQ9382_C3-4625 [Komagataella phaffii CBS 7435]AOA69190.1 GQ68_03370T0 [Komagataella phaffii GS115]CAY70380.1 Hypothetical protein PAS_chr3_0341 [Komagataella phaffii GS115]CCA39826.1 hypothetical protein PP7435_CHR3-0874 [Komagataella phaffii CBS 7435]
MAKRLTVGKGEDPYNEPIPDSELKFYQRKGAKRKRPIPKFLSKHDQKVLKQVRNKAYCLDLVFNLCGFRFGWSAIVQLIPVIGDVISLMLGLRLIRAAQKIEGGLPQVLVSQMTMNSIFDFAIGLIPFVGDIINIAYKANSRNFMILEKHLTKGHRKEFEKLVSLQEEEPPV